MHASTQPDNPLPADTAHAECHRKLNTSQGLSTHCYQVHKTSIKQ